MTGTGVFVWTVSDAIGAAYIGLVLLVLLLVGALSLGDKIQRRWRKWRGGRS